MAVWQISRAAQFEHYRQKQNISKPVKKFAVKQLTIEDIAKKCTVKDHMVVPTRTLNAKERAFVEAHKNAIYDYLMLYVYNMCCKHDIHIENDKLVSETCDQRFLTAHRELIEYFVSGEAEAEAANSQSLSFSSVSSSVSFA